MTFFNFAILFYLLEVLMLNTGTFLLEKERQILNIALSIIYYVYSDKGTD